MVILGLYYGYLTVIVKVWTKMTKSKGYRLG